MYMLITHGASNLFSGYLPNQYKHPMSKLFTIFISLFFVPVLLLAQAQRKNADSPNLTKQTHEEWLQTLPEKVRDSIVYREWKQSIAEQEKQAGDAAKSKIEEVLANPNTTYIDLSYYPYAELDPRLLSLKKLQGINLTKSKKLDLQKLFDLIAKFPELHSLNMADCYFAALPSNIGNLAGIDTLNLRNSNIKALPETFTKLQKLRTLGLAHNAYLYDDDVFEKLKHMNVSDLDLSACGLFALNTKVGDVKSLARLNISINDVKELPASFSQLSNLKYLDLSQNTSLNLAQVAGVLAKVSSLTTLNLDQCYLATLPIEIGSITSLHVLYLRENVLTAVPSTIGNLTAIEELYISSPKNSFRVNVLKNLPDGLGKLSRLRVLDLGGNLLTSLSSDFAQLKSLEVLDLSRNQLMAFPDAITSLIKLKILDLNRNKIPSLPAAIGNLTALDSLTVDGDFFSNPDKKIKALPAEICQISNLKKLTFKDDIIEALPDNFGNLSNLKTLDLRGNLLSALPASFTRLSKLNVLDLKGNELKALPAGFEKLNTLTDLNISLNPDMDFAKAIPQIAAIKSLHLLDISYNNLTRAQAQPLIDGLAGCKIINLDYSNKALPTLKDMEQAPGRNKK